MLWIELRVSYMLGEHSTTELYSCPSIFFNYICSFIYLFACVFVCVLLCKPWYMWRSSNNLQEELVLSFHHMDPRDQIGIIRLASKHLYPWAISMAPFMILLSMYIYYLCTSEAYAYHYYIHTMAQGEARGELLGGSSLLSPCWGSISLVPGPWTSRWPACLHLLFCYRSVGITGSCRHIWLMHMGCWYETWVVRLARHELFTWWANEPSHRLSSVLSSFCFIIFIKSALVWAFQVVATRQNDITLGKASFLSLNVPLLFWKMSSWI